MRCQACKKGTATTVCDRLAADRRPISREMLCRRCSGASDVDVVVTPEDFVQVLASNTCWCTASRRAGVALTWCPQHGQIQPSKE